MTGKIQVHYGISYKVYIVLAQSNFIHTFDLNIVGLGVTLTDCVTRVLLHRTPHQEPVHRAVQCQL